MTDIDEDGSGQLEFVMLSTRQEDKAKVEWFRFVCRFLTEEDEDTLKKELKDAFRIYDKVSRH